MIKSIYREISLFFWPLLPHYQSVVAQYHLDRFDSVLTPHPSTEVLKVFHIWPSLFFSQGNFGWCPLHIFFGKALLHDTSQFLFFLSEKLLRVCFHGSIPLRWNKLLRRYLLSCLNDKIITVLNSFPWSITELHFNFKIPLLVNSVWKFYNKLKVIFIGFLSKKLKH